MYFIFIIYTSCADSAARIRVSLRKQIVSKIQEKPSYKNRQITKYKIHHVQKPCVLSDRVQKFLFIVISYDIYVLNQSHLLR